MTVPPSQPGPLDYEAGRARRRRSRGLIVSSLGGAVAAAGVVVFLLAHELVRSDFDFLGGEHARLHEALWAAFGLAPRLGGVPFAAVGLRSCASRGGG